MTTVTLADGRLVGREVDDVVRSLTVDGGPGVAVVVLRDDRAVYVGCGGYADVEGRVAIGPGTRFRLASVSKQFTAAAVLLLVERGKVSLDTPLTDIFPGLPGYARPVRLRHLLNHTSGLPDYEEHIPEGVTEPLKDVDVLAILAGQSALYFPPGTQYRYSNSAYALLALVVEKYSGRRYPAFLREEIFGPLGMEGAVAYEAGVSEVGMRAYGYSPDKEKKGRYVRTDQSITSAVLGDGGIYASLEEMAKWDAGLYAGKILKPETWKEAWKETTLADEKVSDYGFGWRLGAYRGHRFVGHGGSSIGFRTHIERYVDDHLTIVVLSNRNDVDPQAALRKIADVCFTGAGER